MFVVNNSRLNAELMSWLLCRTSSCRNIRTSMVSGYRINFTWMSCWLFQSVSYTLQKCKVFWMSALIDYHVFLYYWCVQTVQYYAIDEWMHAEPSVLWRCWLDDRKGIRPVKNWVVGCWRGCLGWGANLHIAQQMPLPLTISCSSKSRLVSSSWFHLSGARTAGSPR